MSDKEDLYATILGVRSPWRVTHVSVRSKEEDVTVMITARSDMQHPCPSCGKPCPGYDTPP